MIKAIVFDFDGVILESADIKTRAFRRLFQFAPPDVLNKIVAYHLDHMGISRYVKFRYIYEEILKLPLTPVLEQALGEKFSSLVIEEVLEAPFVPGALEFLQNKQGEYQMFVASGTPETELVHIVKCRGIANYFQEVHGSPRGKTEIIEDILQRFSLKLRELAFVGDALSDYKAAQKTGVQFVARIYPGTDELEQCRYKLQDLRELEDLLDIVNKTLQNGDQI